MGSLIERDENVLFNSLTISEVQKRREGERKRRRRRRKKKNKTQFNIYFRIGITQGIFYSLEDLICNFVCAILIHFILFSLCFSSYIFILSIVSILV